MTILELYGSHSRLPFWHPGPGDAMDATLQQLKREAAARRALGITAKCRFRGSRNTKPTGKVVGTTVARQDVVIHGGEEYVYVPMKDRPDTDKRSQYVSEDGKRLRVDQTRRTMLVVKLARALPEWKRNHSELSKVAGAIPAGYRAPGMPTDADILRLFRRYCERNAITFQPATNPDADGCASDDGSAWYTVASDHRTLNDAFPRTDGEYGARALPWFILQVEQALDLRPPTMGAGMGAFTVASQRRRNQARRDAIAFVEDNGANGINFRVRQSDHANKDETAGILSLLVERFGFFPTDAAINPDGGWAFNAALKFMALKKENAKNPRLRRILRALKEHDSELLESWDSGTEESPAIRPGLITGAVHPSRFNHSNNNPVDVLKEWANSIR